MDCPRCDGPVEGYALGTREAFVCGRCGWVGVDASLGEGDGDGPSESWDDAIGRVADRRVSTDRTTLPPAAAEAIRNAERPSAPTGESTDGDADREVDADATDGEADATTDGEADADATTDGEADTGTTPDEETGTAEDGEPVEILEKIEESDVEPLRAAGIETLEGLATADRVELAAATDIPESRVGDYIRSASIRLVASGSDKD